VKKRSKRSTWFGVLVMGLGVGLICGLMAWGQLLPIPSTSPIGPGLGREHAPDGEPSVTQEMQARQWKRLRAEHQKQMEQDTERMVHLATMLKADVEHGDKASLEAFKSADEIGKLAKRVSERIKSQ
jgi:hypothetical protein